MKALIITALALAWAGCARHHVIERNVGHVDGARSVAISGDEAWAVRSEPGTEPHETP